MQSSREEEEDREKKEKQRRGKKENKTKQERDTERGDTIQARHRHTYTHKERDVTHPHQDSTPRSPAPPPCAAHCCPPPSLPLFLPTRPHDTQFSRQDRETSSHEPLRQLPGAAGPHAASPAGLSKTLSVLAWSTRCSSVSFFLVFPSLPLETSAGYL